MAVTFTSTVRHVYSIGDRKEAILDIACTGSPTGGGDALRLDTLGFTQVDTVDPVGSASNAGGTVLATIHVLHSVAAFSTVTIAATPVPGVTIVFGTASAAPGSGVSLLAYSGATAGLVFRVRVVGKGGAVGVPS